MRRWPTGFGASTHRCWWSRTSPTTISVNASSGSSSRSVSVTRYQCRRCTAVALVISLTSFSNASGPLVCLRSALSSRGLISMRQPTSLTTASDRREWQSSVDRTSASQRCSIGSLVMTERWFTIWRAPRAMPSTPWSTPRTAPSSSSIPPACADGHASTTAPSITRRFAR